METRRTEDLKPHPDNASIYADYADEDLMDSIRRIGIVQPLVITKTGIIISGHRRHSAAFLIGIEEVPVVISLLTDEDDILEAMIESNQQRPRTNEQKAREYIALKEIYNKRLSRQGQRTDLMEDNSILQTDALGEPISNGTSEKDLSDVKPSVQAAKKLGISQPTADKAASVVKAADTLREEGREEEAKEILHILNTTNPTRAVAKMDTILHPPTPVPVTEPKPKKKDWITLSEWNQMSEDDQRVVLATNGTNGLNKQDTDRIEWALWSWNPITGCKHNCPYCYARDIANRFYEQKFEPSLIPERLAAPLHRIPPYGAETDPDPINRMGLKNIFTCSMADLFGRWVPSEWINAVLDTVRKSMQWNFLFLTKFPIRMAEFEFPDNAWVGTTVDCQVRVSSAEKAFRSVRAKVKWLSCEPLLEPLQFTSLDMFQWIVIGGSSRSTHTPEWIPPYRWVKDLERQADDVNCKVYMKTNIGDLRRRDYPGLDVPERSLPNQLKYLPGIS